MRVLMIGLTGGIGAGKSAASARLAELGAVVIDADRLAREVVAAGTPGLREVVEAFGPDVLGPDGSIDRPALGARVFGDDTARHRLEGIIHPRVRACTAYLVAAAGPDAIVVNDVPLLVETGLAPTFHLVVVVDAPQEERVARLVRSRGMASAEAHARIRAQADDEQRRAVADVLLPNAGTIAELNGRVDALWHERLRPFEDNLRHGRSASPSPTASDRGWPERFARVAARLRHAGGDLVGRVDQIGAAALPGAAADALDIQLGLARPDDATALAPRLAAAGFPMVWDGEARSGDGAALAAGLAAAGSPGGGDGEARHAGADPGEPARVYVRVAGSPRWRRDLLMRDWRRAVLGGEDAALPDGGRAAVPDGEDAEAAAERWAERSGWRP